jgi:large subunit ribosomal protein L10
MQDLLDSIRDDPWQGHSGRSFQRKGEKPVKRQEKVEMVQQLQSELARTANVFVAEYRGMTVEQITDLRVKLRKNDGAMRVVKNTFLRRAVDGTDKAAVAAVAKGPNAVILAGADFVELTKVLAATDREIEPFKLKGGVVGGKAVTPDEIRQISMMPPRAVLLARAVGSLASPLRGLLNVCQGNVRNLVYALEAIRQAKEKAAA